MNYLFTSESVSEGHPDKVADQIADSILDEFLRRDLESKVACEVFCSTGLVIIGGEVSSDAYVDVQSIARETILRIGYDKAGYLFNGNSCGVLSEIHEQSPDIRRGLTRQNPEDQGAGDQGMMFGYACRETEDYMPLPIYLSHLTLRVLADIRRDESRRMPYLRPDAKSQFTIEYDNARRPVRAHTIVLSTQHDEFADDETMHARIEQDVRDILIPQVIARLHPETAALFRNDFKLFVNPTGKFVIGGPAADTGLTGRKIIVDTYGGRSAHGGGSFSGKDPSKVDRSACYMARYIAKNLVAAGVADEMTVQVAYAIGVAKPVSVYVDTRGTGKFEDARIARKISDLFDLRPAKIIEKFGLKNPIYRPTAAYGHFGRKPYSQTLKLVRDGREVEKTVEFFGWEKLDAVDAVRKAFNL
ncbi:MAG: methionine adenosyltransferase [Bacteroidales bacterium]|nr:methionine adenosyltransferase [Bacteroidales bacterium]